jgi:hypothetical protein
MKLRARDQIHISNVQAETIRPGQEIEVPDWRGEELLASWPGMFEQTSAPVVAAAEEPAGLPAAAIEAMKPRQSKAAKRQRPGR